MLRAPLAKHFSTVRTTTKCKALAEHKPPSARQCSFIITKLFIFGDLSQDFYDEVLSYPRSRLKRIQVSTAAITALSAIITGSRLFH